MSLRAHVAAVILLGANLPAPALAVVVHDPGGPQPVCVSSRAANIDTSEDAERVVRDFVRAYNDGDLVRLEQAFSPEPEFEWYTVSRGVRQEVTAYDRATLRPYFARRHEAGDRLSLLELDVRDERGWHGGFDFTFRLVRSSAQHRAEGRYHGKGAAGCAIFVWSMGRES